MAWEEIKFEENEQLNAEEYSPYNLPVPDEKDMDDILRRGIGNVRKGLKKSPDPLFNKLKLVPPGGRRGRGGAGGQALPTGASESNWQEVGNTPPDAAIQPEKEEDGYYQRAIYGMERGGAGMVQSFSIQQSEGLLNLLKQVEKDPEAAQRMADLQGQAYGLEFKDGHIDPEKYKDKVREQIVKKSESQQIRRDAMSGIPVSEALAAMGEAKTFGEGWDAFTDDVVGITIEGLSQSIPAMAPGLLAALFIGPAAAPLFGATSFAVERGGMIEETMLELAEKHGYDLSTLEGQQALVDSPAFKAKMKKITTGAAAVGIADTISGIIPGIKLIKGKPIKEFFAQLAVQSGLGASGEASKQLIVEGKISAPGDVILEAVLEVPGGALEIAAVRANVLEQRKIDAKASGDVPGPDGGPSDNKGGGTTQMPDSEGPSQTIDVGADVTAEAAPMKAGEVDPALSAALDEQAAVTEPTQPTQPTQPSQVVEDKTTPETVATTESPTVDEAQLETKTDKVESPMIDRKTLTDQLRELSVKEPKSVRAVRKAWKGVMEALTKRFPDTKLPLPSRTFGAPAIANFFATLQEEVNLTEAMPDLKLFLETVATGNSAQVIDALNRVTNAVIADIPSATVGETGKISSQMVSGVNVYDAAEETRLKKASTVETVDKKTGKKKISKRVGGLANRLKARAIVVDELATVVESGINYLKENGGLELIPEGATALIRRARSYREGSQVTKRRTLPSGTVVEPKKFSGKNLDEVGGKLRELAEAIAGVVASRELNKAEIKDTKAKVEATSSTTEDVTAPKMSRSKKPKRNPLGVKELSPKETTLTPNEAREQRKDQLAEQLEAKEKQIAEAKKITEPKVQTKAEKLQELSKKRAATKKTGTKKVTKKQKETARVKAEIEQGQADLKAAVKPEQRPTNELAAANVNELKHTELRRLAKHLGIPATGSKASLIEGINAWRDNAKKITETVRTPRDVKDRKANMDKLLELAESDDLVSLAVHFRNVGQGIVDLTKAERAKIAKALGAEVVSDVDKTIANIMSAAYDIQKEYRAQKKETVKGAKPEEVLEVEEVIVKGKQSKTMLEKAGFAEGTTLPEALEEAGVSSKAARVIRGLIKAVKPKQQEQIVAAVLEYGSNADNAEAAIRLIAQLAEITGKQPSQDIVAALMEYGDARSQSLMEYREDQLQSDIDADVIAEAQGMSREDSDFLADELGLATSSFDEDTDAGMSEDDFKDKHFQGRKLPTGTVGLQKYVAKLNALIERVEESLFGETDVHKVDAALKLTGKLRKNLARTEQDLSDSIHAEGRGKLEIADSLREQASWRLDKLGETIDTLLKDHKVFTVNEKNYDAEKGKIVVVKRHHFNSREEATAKFNELRGNLTGNDDRGVSTNFTLNENTQQERAVRALIEEEETGGRNAGKDLKEDRVLFRAMNKMKSFFADRIGGTTTVSEVLQVLVDSLPTNHRYHILAQRLLRLNMDIPVEITDQGEPILDKDGKQIALGMGWFRPGRDMSERLIQLVFDEKSDTHGELIERSLHEVLHAALWHAYRTNPAFKAEIDTLYAEAVAEFKSRAEEAGKVYSFEDIESSGFINTLYGLKNPEEFMVEVMTNLAFQRELAGIPSQITTTYTSKLTNIMQRIWDALTKFLGYSVRNNILERVFKAVSINLMSESEQAKHELSRKNNPQRFSTKKLYAEGPVEPTKITTKERHAVLDAVRRTNEGVVTQTKSVLKEVRNLGHRADLMFSARDVIERNKRKLFEKGAKALAMVNPVTRYNDAKSSASSIANRIEKAAVKIVKRMVQLDNKSTSRMLVAMRDITNAEIYADKPLKHPDNAHLWTTHKDGTVALRAKYATTAPAARQMFIDLAKQHPKAAKLLLSMANLTEETLTAKREGSLISMGQGFRFEESVIKALRKVRTDADVDALFPTTSDEDFTALKISEANTKEEKQAKKEQLDTVGTNNAANKSAKKILELTGIKGMYFPLRRYGDYVVSTPSGTPKADAYTSFHATQKQAEAMAAKLSKKGLDVNVSLKTEKNAVPKNIAAVIAEITDKIKDPDTRLALRGALAETLAESVAYASQMKRYNIDGIAAADMGRAFEEYIKVSKYTIGDLVTSHRVSRALVDMRTVARNEEGTLSIDEAIEAGLVVNEIAKQNKDEADERNPSELSKAVGLIGFLNFLGAPSYWALNSTQTLTITVPYMHAIWGNKGVTALFKSYGVIFEAVYKAMASGNPSYELFVSYLPEAARKVVAELEKSTIIQSTLAHQFGTTFSPSMFKQIRKLSEDVAGKPGQIVAATPQMVLHIMEKVPEAIEHFNRISTALAIYEVANGDMVAVKDGVQETQFNYETSNRARGLKRWGSFAGRGLISPVMMFKTHGFGVARLLYGGMIDAVYQKGRNRKQALRLVAGLIATHTLFAGVAGGFMMYPVVLLIGLANMIFREAGDEFDLEEAAEEFGRELGGDAMGTLIARGLSAYLGADWSNSVNLGNLIWMGNDRADPSKPYGWAAMVYKHFGPMAQYVGDTARETAMLIEGSPKGGPRDFFEAAVPVKVMRGLLQAWKYSEEGIETDGGLTLVKDTDFDKWDIFLTTLGFQSSVKTDTTSWYYREQGRLIRRRERRSVLVRKMVEAIDKGDSITGLIDDAIDFNLSLPPGGEVNMIIPGADMAMYRSRQRTNDRNYLKKQVTR